MSDERRHLVVAVAGLVVVALVFAGIVVMLTRSGLDLAGDPMNRLPSDEAECYDMVRAAAEAARGGRAADARRTLVTAEALACGPDVVRRIGQVYRELGDSREAIRVLEACAPRGGDPEVLADVAGAWADLGEADSARAALDRAILLPGATPQAVRSLAWTSLALGENATGRGLFSRAVALFPHDHELWRALSEILLQEGDIAGSIDAAKRAVSLAPSSGKAHVALGWAFEAAGDAAQARAALQQALALSPADSFIVFEIGRFHHRAGRDADALPYLTEATQAVSCPVEWLLMRAQSEQRLGRFVHARGTLRLACSRFPGDYRPFLDLAKLERWHGDRAEARFWVRKARALAPEEPAVIRFEGMLG